MVTTANRASVEFHENAGYRLTATFPDCGFKHGSWHGTLWLEKSLSSVEIPTSEPIGVGSVVDFDRKFREILDTLSLS